MAKIFSLKRRLMMILAGCVTIAGILTAVARLPMDRQIELANIVIPSLLLGMVTLIWLRQRQAAKLSETRLQQSAEACARLTLLANTLEQEILSKPTEPHSHGHSNQKTESAMLNSKFPPTIH